MQARVSTKSMDFWYNCAWVLQEWWHNWSSEVDGCIVSKWFLSHLVHYEGIQQFVVASTRQEDHFFVWVTISISYSTGGLLSALILLCSWHSLLQAFSWKIKYTLRRHVLQDLTLLFKEAHLIYHHLMSGMLLGYQFTCSMEFSFDFDVSISGTQFLRKGPLM